MKLASRFLRQNGEAFFQKNISRIETLIHIHDRNARVGITRKNRRLDRGSSPVARKERGVEIQAGQLWDRQHLWGQKLTVGHDHHHIGIPCTEGGHGFLAPKADGLLNGNPSLERKQLDRRCSRLHIAPSGLVRLGDHRADLVFFQVEQRPQSRRSDVPRATKNNTHGIK